MDTKWKIAFIALVALILLGLAFYAGRATTKTKVITKIEYIKGDTIHDTITDIKPYKVIVPADTAGIIQTCVEDGIYAELFPTKVVTEYIEVTKEDTTAIMKDWATVRAYDEVLFDSDTLGVCEVNTEVQYNRIKNMNYTFTPVIKKETDTEIKVRRFTPFIGAGISTFPSVDGSVGFFINQSWGFSLDGNYYFNGKTTEGMPEWSVGMKILKEF